MENKDKIASLVAALLPWYAQNARDLPWRRTKDPYLIAVSEIMLQQTQVKTVIPFWERWARELPTIAAAAKAKADKLHKLWEGLGYYTRVRNLQKAAQMIMERHGGVFPEAFDDVLALPGIGRYTAGAICSIAFNQPTPILDGNVMRVLTRVFGLAENPREKRTNERLWVLAEQLVTRAARIAPKAERRPPGAARGKPPGPSDLPTAHEPSDRSAEHPLGLMAGVLKRAERMLGAPVHGEPPLPKMELHWGHELRANVARPSSAAGSGGVSPPVPPPSGDARRTRRRDACGTVQGERTVTEESPPSPRPSPPGEGEIVAASGRNQGTGLVSVQGGDGKVFSGSFNPEIREGNQEKTASVPGSAGSCSALNQALMELGALVCTPRNAQCVSCPLRKLCVAFRQDRVAVLPNLGRRERATTRRFVAYVLERDGKFLVRQRPAGAVNAHLWEFPNVELAGPNPGGRVGAVQATATAGLGFAAEALSPLLTVKHSITRYRITLEAFRVKPGRVQLPESNAVWKTPGQLRRLAFTSAHRRILRAAVARAGVRRGG